MDESSSKASKPSRCILIAEDNPADVFLIRESLETTNALGDVNLTVVSDGERALDYLFQRGDYTNAHRPDLIVLDLNLPKVDGIEILQHIRQSGRFHNIPVIVLTSSDSPNDRNKSESLGADRFITKPSDLDAFLSIGGVLLSYVERRKSR